MRRARGCAVAVLLILVPPLSGEVPVPKPGGVMLELFPEGDVEPPPEAESDAAALPEPSLEEPFAIGEALYDPEGVPLAVVSLLDLMGVPIVADQAAADRAGRLTLSEAEVLELIDQGVEDATAAAESDDGSPPHTFADLHAWIAPFLNGIDAAGLAARYARAYERRPDDLVPAVLMGQPIEPETPLTRVQIWLLLVDGFVGPGERTGTAALDGRGDGGRPAYAVLRGARPSPAIPVAGRNTSWGTALPGTQNVIGRLLDIADFPWVTAHLPMLQSRVPFTISPGSAVAHEGHGGNGQRVVFEASIGPAAGPITAPSGRPVLVPRPSASVAGVPIRWVPSQEDEETFEAHGTFQAALFTAMPTDAAGKVRLPYVPKRENANGVGRLRRERATMKASVKVRDLVFSRYELAPEFASFRPQLESGGYRATRSPARIEWHSDGLELELTSQFDVALDLQALGKTHRWGFEGVRGSLARISDGLYRGRVLARTLTAHIGGGLGKVCSEDESFGTQWFEATARKVTGLNRYQNTTYFDVAAGQPDGGYYELSFKPLTSPVFTERDDCQDNEELLYRACSSCKKWLPFNDARWTTKEHAWVIAIPSKGKLDYRDKSLADPPLVLGSGAPLPLAPEKDLGPFKAFIKGTFTETRIEAERTDRP